MNTEQNEDSYDNLSKIYPEIKALSDQVKMRFIVAFELRSKYITETKEIIEKLPNHLQVAPLSFLAAMTAISDAACLPQRIAYGQAWQHAQSTAFIHALHTINKKGFLLGENQEEASTRVIKQAHAAAAEEMKTLVNSETRFNQVFKQSIETLLFDCFGQSTEQAARELRYQTTVAIWSSLEVLIKDQLIQIINWKPELAKKLTTDEIAKKRFELPKLTYDELEDRDFNFQNCMGDLLIKQRDASDLLTLKAAIGAIWGKNELYKRLDSAEIRLLNLQRHLIVHRRGIVDKKYLYQSGDSLSEGNGVRI